MATFPDVTAKALRRRAGAERAIRREGQTMTLRQFVNAGDEWAPLRVPTDTTIIAVDLNERIRNAQGTLTGETRRSLLVSTSAGVTLEKGNKVAVGFDKDAFALLTEAQQIAALHEIDEVRPLAPGGTVILWEVDLAT